MNTIFYYTVLAAMLCYTAIDYCGGNFMRSGLWLMIAAVMVIIREIKKSSSPVLYENCTFISATPEEISGTKEDNSNGK